MFIQILSTALGPVFQKVSLDIYLEIRQRALYRRRRRQQPTSTAVVISALFSHCSGRGRRFRNYTEDGHQKIAS